MVADRDFPADQGKGCWKEYSAGSVVGEIEILSKSVTETNLGQQIRQ